jgi:hypothetical protein
MQKAKYERSHYVMHATVKVGKTYGTVATSLLMKTILAVGAGVVEAGSQYALRVL